MRAFRYLDVLFTSRERIEREIDRWKDGMVAEGAESNGNAFDLLVYVPHL